METHSAEGKGDSDTKIEELMGKTQRTLVEVKSILEMEKLDSKSNLYRLMGDIKLQLTGVVEQGTVQFKEVGKEEWSKALHKSHRGALCLKVYRACKENGLKNSLFSIMRGLLNPMEQKDIEVAAKEELIFKRENFSSEMDLLFLMFVMKKLPKSKTKVSNKVFLGIIEHFDEFLQLFQECDT